MKDIYGATYRSPYSRSFPTFQIPRIIQANMLILNDPVEANNNEDRTLPDGEYILYSRALSHTGQKLAISFNGNDAYATVKPLGYSQDQIVSRPLSTHVLHFPTPLCPSQWSIRFFNGSTYSVSPRGNTHLQAAWGSEGVKVMSAGNYVWTFTNNGQGFVYVVTEKNRTSSAHVLYFTYRIQDGDRTKYWGVTFANLENKVT